MRGWEAAYVVMPFVAYFKQIYTLCLIVRDILLNIVIDGEK
jgi:hypothetical protein